MAGRAKRTGAEKLADSNGLPKVVTLTGKAGEKWGAGTMVIPAPVEVDEQMRRVPRGRLVTTHEIRGRWRGNMGRR